MLRRRSRQRVGCSHRAVGAAEAAVGAAAARGSECAEYVSARLLAYRALGHEQRALVLALVHNAGYPGLADDVAFHRQWPHDAESLLAVHHVAARDADVGMRVPRPGIAENDGHCRQRLQPFLVDELELARVAGVGAKADTQRIENGVAPRETLRDFGDVPVDELVV